MGKVSSYSYDTSPAATDYMLGNQASGPTTKKFKIQDILAVLAAGGSELSAAITGYTPTVSGVQNLTVGTPVGKYLNLGGLKILWGTCGYSYVGSSATGRMSLSLPSGFFTSVDYYAPAIMAEGNDAFQVASGDSIVGSPPATLGFYVSNGGATGSGVVSFLLIGT